MSGDDLLSAGDLTARLAHSRAALTAAIEGMDEEAFRRRTASGDWNAAEVLAHLLAHERRFLELAQRALAEERPAVQSRGEGQQLEEAKAAQRMPVPQIVHGLLAQRRDTLRVLERLGAAELERPLQHSRLGEISPRWLFRRLAEHETEHAQQITSMRKALAGTAT